MLKSITEAHGGRTGVIARDNERELARFAYTQLLSLTGWDIATFTLPARSASEVAMLEACASGSLRSRSIARFDSPFVVLEKSWEDQLAALPKKMRWTVRKSIKQLSSLGSVTYERYEDPTDRVSLLSAIDEIERNSWKENANTSLTAQEHQRHFFVSLLENAGSHVSAHILFIDKQPIAYILGLRDKDTFLDLKESFSQSYAPYSPGHALKRFAIDHLIASGIKIYDFMGRCEPYKLKWTDRTYTRVTTTIYNRTMRGSLAYARSVIKTSVGRSGRHGNHCPRTYDEMRLPYACTNSGLRS
jgi:CelD/BcsL family acetyltransferase involved in cellulose biosynthesis